MTQQNTEREAFEKWFANNSDSSSTYMEKLAARSAYQAATARQEAMIAELEAIVAKELARVEHLKRHIKAYQNAWDGKDLSKKLSALRFEEAHGVEFEEAYDAVIAQLTIAVEALEFYANKSNYDCDYDIGMEVSHRVILYKDQYEHNQQTYYAGRTAIEALAKIKELRNE